MCLRLRICPLRFERCRCSAADFVLALRRVLLFFFADLLRLVAAVLVDRLRAGLAFFFAVRFLAVFFLAARFVAGFFLAVFLPAGLDLVFFFVSFLPVAFFPVTFFFVAFFWAPFFFLVCLF